MGNCNYNKRTSMASQNQKRKGQQLLNKNLYKPRKVWWPILQAHL